MADLEDGSTPDPQRHALPGDGALGRTLALVRFLRRECPWDAKQTPETLVSHLLEESHEVADAIRGGRWAELDGELGDLLLNLAFQIVIGEERGYLDAESVTAALEAKMRGRHPHLFGLGEKEGWEILKARERKENEGDTSVLSGLSSTMDPLLKAQLMQERVSGVGFDWSEPAGALAKVREELEEVVQALEGEGQSRLEEEVGDLLFAVVNLSRLTSVDSHAALDRANRKFTTRFQRLEELARERSVSMPGATLEELDQLWDEVKAEE